MPEPSGRDRRFCAFLRELADEGAEAEGRRPNPDRAALAALRRGLGKPPGTAIEMYPYVEPWVGDERPDVVRAYYLVASLYALHPRSWRDEKGDSNFGASLSRLKQALARRGRSAEGVERRFVALLNSHADGLATHLRHAVALLRQEDVPVDWPRLVADVRAWEHPLRGVQRSWARVFWGHPAAEDGAVTEEKGVKRLAD